MLKTKLLKYIDTIKGDHDKFLPILIVLTGLFSGIIAVLFRLMIHWFEEILFFDKLIPFIDSKLYFFLIPVICSSIAGMLIYYFYPQSKGSGIPNTKIALFYNYGILPFKEILGKFITGLVSISSGLSVGREGPTIFMASNMGSTLGKIFSIKRSKIRNLTICGAAGGLAAAFNTPIASITFVIEELIGDLGTSVLGATVISAVLASTIQRLILGNHPAFHVAAYTLKSSYEYFFYVILGVLAGIAAALFIKSMILSTRIIKKIKIPNSLKPIIGGILIGVALLTIPKIVGFNYHKNSGPASAIYYQIEDVIASSLSFKLILVFFIYRFIATIICYTSGASGGIFAPTLFIGAMLGGLLGIFFTKYFPEITANYGAYALVGMGAFFAGVIQTPITSILIIFEMTHNYNIVLPLMMANMISFTIARKFSSHSVYDELLKEDGIELPTIKPDFRAYTVEEAMTSPATVISHNLTIEEAHKLFKARPYYSYPIVNDKGYLVGLLRYYMIRKYISKNDINHKIKDILKDKAVYIYTSDNLDMALRIMASYEMTVLPVLDNRKNNKVVGVITHRDVLKVYNDKVIKD